MRYLRMYVLVNVIITGVMRAADTPQEFLHDTSVLPVDEEPPQEKVSEPDVSSEQLRQQQGDGESVPAAENSASSIEPSVQPPTIEADETKKQQENQEPVIQEPTLEDAEKVIEEGTQEFATVATTGDELPMQPGVMPSALPAVPITHTATPTSEIEKTEKEHRGIDTVNLEQPQGNWLFKRYWWERAEEVYKKMRLHAEKINDIRVKFFARRTELDKTILDPFYFDIGLTQGELQSSMQSLMAQLEQERTEEGTLSQEERELMETAQKDRERLEQLQRDVRGVGAMRDAADKVIDRVIDQKKRVTVYETEAWESMREIGRIVSDTQASELYYRMDAGWRTVKDIYRYIDQDLSRYFDKLLVNTKEQTERIKTALQALKEQGVDLKSRIQQAHEQAIEQEKAIEDKDKDKKAVTTAKTGWFASTSRIFQAVIDVAIWQFLQSIWDIIMWLPRRIYSMVTSLFR